MQSNTGPSGETEAAVPLAKRSVWRRYRLLWAAAILAGLVLLLTTLKTSRIVTRRPTNLHAIDPVALRELGRPGRAAGANLLLFTLDTVRADRLGCYGYPPARTPTIDALTEHGVQFLQAIAPAPITLPSHATILTGLDVPSHGARDNGTFRLADEHTTLAEALGAYGYTTAAFVSAFVLDARYGLDQGFGHYDDDVHASRERARSGAYHERTAADVTDSAIRWLEQALGAADAPPFFAWVHYFDPHAPYAPPRQYVADSRTHPYDGEIAFVNAQLGRLIKFLDQRGALDQTLIVLAGDHGEGLGEHGENTHSHLIYDTTLRVPLIVSSPTLFDRRVTVHDRVVSLADIFPTVLDLVGIPATSNGDGMNLLTTPPDDERAIYVETMAPMLNNGWAPLYGLRRLKDKYIQAPRPEYYDIQSDPHEELDLYGSSRRGAAALETQLTTLMERWGPLSRVIDQAADLDPEEARRLAALGYVRADHIPQSRQGLDPKDMIVLWQRLLDARAMSASGAHEAALAEQVLEQNPNDAQAWRAASLINKRLQRWDRAEACILRSLELQPTADAYVRLAQFLLRRGRKAECDEALARAVGLDPGDGGIYITRGDRFALAGRFREALLEFETALEVDPIRWGDVARQKIAAARARLQL